ncbi:MAG TPA: ABC transporter substrate-binding protein [Spirochaetota bacterium]|nr:ABC transporter substrate-binding protein [Spirochaetota bacterium]
MNTIRIGHFPNITHSQAIIGLARGDFSREIGTNVRIDVKRFNAGPAAIEALFAGSLDICYIGPNPAINGYVKSHGKALRILAGATSGGAALIVRKESGIVSDKDFSGKKIATPQLGNTQDVALRAWLTARGLHIGEKPDEVAVLPVGNPQAYDLFRQGKIDAAWLPEPWASRLEIEAGGRLYLDERTLWPEGDFVTAHVIVRTEFMKTRPDVVAAWLRGHAGVTAWIGTNGQLAKKVLNDELARITGKAIPVAVLEIAWWRMRVTWDPVAGSLKSSAEAAWKAGILPAMPVLDDIYELRPLNAILRERSLPVVKGL